MNCRTLVACLTAVASLAPFESAAVPADSPSSSPIPIVLLRRSEKKAPESSSADVLVAARPESDDIARRAGAALTAPEGFGQQVLRLDRFVRNYLLRDPKVSAGRRAVLSQPAFLFLSDREGGYPAESFWLEQPGGRLEEMRDVTFVDMIVDDRGLAAGRVDGFLEIYAHELGHLMMAALAGPAPKRASSAMHFVTTRTDAWFAFVEGFGEHFQPIGLDWQRDPAVQASRGKGAPDTERTWFARFEREQVEGCVVCPANLRFLRWHGAREQRFRDVPLRANQFVFLPPLPGPLVDGSRPPFEGRLYRDLASPPADGALKNGVQMMESEGVMATLFYRLVNDPRLQQAYRDPAFYTPFLDEAQAADVQRVGPRAVVTPLENVYLKLFDVMHRSFAWGDWPAVNLVNGYARQFPDEAAAVYGVFLEVTRGVTVAREASARHREAGYLASLRDRLLAGEARIDANLGPALWLNSGTMTFTLGIYRYFLVPSSFTFDLNAAEAPDLLSVPGVSAPLAAAIVRERDARGHFDRVDDLAAVAGVTPELTGKFRSMYERMQARLNRSEPRRADSGWFRNVMVPILRASYYVAAAWQFGLALVLAGLAFAMSRWAAWRAFERRASVGQSGRPSSAESGGWRARLRRARRALGGGMAASILPCLVSVAFYSQGVLPSAANMAPVGLALGALYVLARVLLRRPPAASPAVVAPGVVAITIASAVIGLMY